MLFDRAGLRPRTGLIAVDTNWSVFNWTRNVTTGNGTLYGTSSSDEVRNVINGTIYGTSSFGLSTGLPLCTHESCYGCTTGVCTKGFVVNLSVPESFTLAQHDWFSDSLTIPLPANLMSNISYGVRP